MDDDYKSFFRVLGDYSVSLEFQQRDGEVSATEITVEDLYQQFKARMLAEMKAEAQEAQRRYMDIRMKMPRKKEG